MVVPVELVKYIRTSGGLAGKGRKRVGLMKVYGRTPMKKEATFEEVANEMSSQKRDVYIIYYVQIYHVYKTSMGQV